MLKEVFIFTNGNIIAFDQDGQQVPKCQGFILDVKVIENIVENADKKTKFKFGKWQEWQEICNFSWWFEKRKEIK